MRTVGMGYDLDCFLWFTAPSRLSIDWRFLFLFLSLESSREVSRQFFSSIFRIEGINSTEVSPYRISVSCDHHPSSAWESYPISVKCRVTSCRCHPFLSTIGRKWQCSVEHVVSISGMNGTWTEHPRKGAVEWVFDPSILLLTSPRKLAILLLRKAEDWEFFYCRIYKWSVWMKKVKASIL